MILSKATKLLTAQLHVLCILLVSHLVHCTNENDFASKEAFELDQADRDLQTKPYVNIRLFWDRSYRWQETSKETFWCMTCSSSSCEKNSKVEVKWCNRSDSRQQWYFDRDKIRSRKNKRMCLQRSGRSIKLKPCSRSKYQKWSELRKDKPFELQIPGNSDKCASQHHHPKDREEIYMESCKLAEKADTSKWVAY